jgi:hypothetical protein
VDDPPVEEGGSSSYRGEKPQKEEYLQHIVERKPEAKEEVSHLLCQGDQGKCYPVGHPVHIFLGMEIKSYLIGNSKMPHTVSKGMLK